MLDLNHPQTRYVFEAAHYEDQIRERLVRLQAEPGNWDGILQEILSGPLPQLRRLLHERFEDRPGIARKLDAIEDAIRTRRPLDAIWRAFLALEELSDDTFGTGFI